MKPYVPIYGPPISSAIPLEEQRRIAFNSDDQEMFFHVGHFTVWYGTAEFVLTLLIHAFTGNIHPRQFHALTKGMDGRIKIERLKTLVKIAGWKLSPSLEKRIEHFLTVMVNIRNTLMHSHFYWPENGDLQLTSIGAPPIIDSEQLGDDPVVISGLALFERGTWLSLFAADLIEIQKALPKPPLPEQGILGTGPLHSPLPTGHHPKTGPKASPAKKHMQPQKQKRGR